MEAEGDDGLFFEQEYIELSIVNVVKLEREINFIRAHSARSYSSISLRYDSEATIECGGDIYDVSNKICYFPGSMPYVRSAKRDNLIAIDFETPFGFSNHLEFFVPKDMSAYRSLFEEAWNCWSVKETGYKFRTAAIVYKILALAHEENSKNNATHPLVEKAVGLIERRISEKDFRIDDLAQELYVSASYLRMLFNAELNTSPKQYLQRRRFSEAVSLLKTQLFTVAEVADQVGFNDSKHFAVEFKRVMGMSPSEYMNSHKILQ